MPSPQGWDILTPWLGAHYPNCDYPTAVLAILTPWPLLPHDWAIFTPWLGVH